MHFQVIKDDFFKKLFTFLKTTVPEFVTVFDEEDGIYPILGEFGRFMINNIFDKELMVKCFDFLNQSLEKGSQETEDAIVVQIFEPLYEEENLSDITRVFLKGHALDAFEKFNPRNITR